MIMYIRLSPKHIVSIFNDIFEWISYKFPFEILLVVEWAIDKLYLTAISIIIYPNRT
jgi:hypothetical protein